MSASVDRPQVLPGRVCQPEKAGEFFTPKGNSVATQLSIRRCRQCSTHFRGFEWQRLCRVCYAWAVAARRIFAAQRALRTIT